MGKFVIGPGVALRLAAEAAVLASDVKLLAPTLMRSELLDLLFRAVNEGKMPAATAKSFVSVETVKAAIDQCARVGFEMVILTFGSTLRYGSSKSNGDLPRSKVTFSLPAWKVSSWSTFANLIFIAFPLAGRVNCSLRSSFSVSPCCFEIVNKPSEVSSAI